MGLPLAKASEVGTGVIRELRRIDRVIIYTLATPVYSLFFIKSNTTHIFRCIDTKQRDGEKTVDTPDG